MENINIKAYRTINSEKLASYPVIKSDSNMIIKRTSKTAIVIATNKTTFKAWWREMKDHWTTEDATEYCQTPVHYKAQDVYVIKTMDKGAQDVMDVICAHA